MDAACDSKLSKVLNIQHTQILCQHLSAASRPGRLESCSSRTIASPSPPAPASSPVNCTCCAHSRPQHGQLFVSSQNTVLIGHPSILLGPRPLRICTAAAGHAKVERRQAQKQAARRQAEDTTGRKVKGKCNRQRHCQSGMSIYTASVSYRIRVIQQAADAEGRKRKAERQAEGHLPVRDVDVHRVFIIQQAADVCHGRVQQAVPVAEAPPLFRPRQRAGVRQRRHLCDLQ
jgi:hypothetical protein